MRVGAELLRMAWGERLKALWYVYSIRIHFSLGFGHCAILFSVICAPPSGPQLSTAESQRTLQYSEERGQKRIKE